MVVLTIVSEKNGKTIYFEDPIPKVHFMKLISCSLYNSWDTLKKEGSAQLGDIESREGVSIGKILPGNYDLESLAKEINKLFGDRGQTLPTEIYKPFGQLVIYNITGKNIEFDSDLANLFGIEWLKTKKIVKRVSSPTTYFIHCDLIDNEQNLFNGKKKDLLAVFYVKGKPYEKVSYHASPQQVLRDCSTDQFINSITLSVKDEHGEHFDFKGMPRTLWFQRHANTLFELELN